LYRTSSIVMSAVIAACGAVMIVSALAGGGGPLSVGVVVGLLFLALGAGRLYLWLWRGRS
jgi:hypothetical protein